MHAKDKPLLPRLQAAADPRLSATIHLPAVAYPFRCEYNVPWENRNPVAERTNEEWIEALRGPDRDEALADLRRLLVRALRVALSGKGKLTEADLDDFAQDALLRIVDALDSFRGEARFTTWAYKVAIRVALSELRRRRWRDVSLDYLTGAANGDFIPSSLADPALDPEQQAIQRMVLDTIRRAIAEDLTEKQRKALVAARVHGMPMEVIAQKMGTNRNALYKLLHDARKRLQKALTDKGLSPDEVMSAFGVGEQVRTKAASASSPEVRDDR
jgi:RNA polymerase sigma-70 factor (ECF subfamily)